MKKNLLIPVLFLLFIFAALTQSCKKGIKDPVTLDKAAGKWSINAVHYKIYNGTSTSRDSTVPWHPVTENFVIFDGISSMDYCFNSATSSPGEYAFATNDSIEINLKRETTRWKISLLTETNFNIESTSTDNPSFPGAKVVTYQNFVR